MDRKQKDLKKGKPPLFEACDNRGPRSQYKCKVCDESFSLRKRCDRKEGKHVCELDEYSTYNTELAEFICKYCRNKKVFKVNYYPAQWRMEAFCLEKEKYQPLQRDSHLLTGTLLMGDAVTTPAVTKRIETKVTAEVTQVMDTTVNTPLFTNVEDDGTRFDGFMCRHCMQKVSLDVTAPTHAGTPDIPMKNILAKTIIQITILTK
eukprot:CAMPEP_0113848934 /NCGR_PEP_ID=MMETSP0372-20130328/2789_1 /TAXON_ID=340204 /ORGANISM="Lankesteria abbotti" /LENGTH=204 /DNA_ID=CAMNT_0000818545 /DNA_START=296 /DNA_END=911 /DNA_ORIENTATION=+ /assembly_acc=CAM_ASM_000359